MATTNGGLKGNAPAIFDGNQSKSKAFLREFQLYRILNSRQELMSIPFRRVALALTYIKEEKVDDWVDAQAIALAEKTQPP